MGKQDMPATRVEHPTDHTTSVPPETGSGETPRHAPTGLHLVVGGDGMIGAELTLRLGSTGPVAATSRRPSRAGGPSLSLDLAVDPGGWELPDRVAVAYLCGAVTSVDRCRKCPDETKLVNVDRTLQLAQLLRRRGAHVIFLSTSLVFDGSQSRPPEATPPTPQTAYGRQKVATETGLLAAGGATVVRFTKVVGPGMALLRTWAESLRRSEPVTPFRDMVLSPIPLSFATEVLVRAGESRPGGVFQVSGDRDVSYADIAVRLAKQIGASRNLVRPVAYADAGLPPEMAPPNTALGTDRLAGELGLTAPPVWDTIDALIRELADRER